MGSPDVFVLSAVRSPIGSFNGSLSSLQPAELGGIVAKEAISRAGVSGEAVSFASVGNCIPTESRYPYVARVLSIQAGMAMNSVSFAVNRLCGSAQQAVVSSAQSLMLGDANLALAGGVEVMTNGAYLLPALRNGARMGDAQAIDGMVSVLTDPFGEGHMGVTAENLASKYGISRAEQDEFAFESQQRALKAISEGHFESQIVPITIKSRKGETVFSVDEYPKSDISLEGLAKLRPVFKKDGTVTAGNASGINDAASFLVMANDQGLKSSSKKPLARLVSYAISGVSHEVMGEGPIPSSQLALKKAGLKLEQIDLIESNEAFAAQAIAVQQGLGLDLGKTNVNGGAISLGHPVGATGAVIITKVLHEMHRRQVRYGMATMCIGGGQGITTIYERV